LCTRSSTKEAKVTKLCIRSSTKEAKVTKSGPKISEHYKVNSHIKITSGSSNLDGGRIPTYSSFVKHLL
jgi:hypothetical protein